MPTRLFRPPGHNPDPRSPLGRPRFDAKAVADPQPAPTQIPICWLSQPVQLRLEQPYNYAEVGQANGTRAVANDADSVSEVGTFAFTATLNTMLDADPAALATWTVAYQATPRVGAPTLIIDLLYRTEAEISMLLRIDRHQRIQLTGVPPEFPEGASNLVITGRTNELAVNRRRITFTTAPVIGLTAGIPGPWFRVDASLLDGSDILPF